MKFSTRNAFYLRVSNYRVIPLFLYLDERHVDWMSDRVMQLVIAELQPKMPELLMNAKFEKKHKVFVERGEGYQYCYFLRTTTRTEVVLLKRKTYSLRPPTPPQHIDELPDRLSKRSRSASTVSPRATRAPRRTSRARGRSASLRDDSPPLVPISDDQEALQLHSNTDGVQVKHEPDADDLDENQDPVNIKDWKPDVDVTFKGFGTSSVQLVLIIEPYPPLPASEYAPPSSRLSSRSASIATSRSRSRQTGTGRYSSSSLSVPVDPRAHRSQTVNAPNMRNASASVTPAAQSRRGGTSTPFDGSTPGPDGSERERASRTPLFLPRDTPFGEDEEDEEEHEAYEMALREGRMRLPSVSRPAGVEEEKSHRRSISRKRDVEADDDLDDIPETLEAMSQRLVRSSEIEEGITRVQGGWEERVAGEESAVLGREEPGD